MTVSDYDHTHTHIMGVWGLFVWVVVVVVVVGGGGGAVKGFICSKCYTNKNTSTNFSDWFSRGYIHIVMEICT